MLEIAVETYSINRLILKTMKNNVSRAETNILKGVAIIMMLWLHLFSKGSEVGNYTDFNLANGQPLAYFLTRLCTPVSFFLILSGYGLAYLYHNNRLSPRTQVPRLLKLYIHYWLILLVFVPIGAFIKPIQYPGTITDILLNLLSWSHTYNYETWFLLPYALISISSLYIIKIVERVGLRWAVPCAFFLYLVSSFLFSRYGSFVYSHLAVALVVEYIQFLFSIVLGILLFKSKYVKEPLVRGTFIYVALFVLFALRCILPTAAFDPIYSFLVIVLVLRLPMPMMAKRVLGYLGDYSMIVWLSHTFFCYYLFHDFIYGFKYPLVIFMVLVVISLLVGVIIRYLATKIVALLRL